MKLRTRSRPQRHYEDEGEQYYEGSSKKWEGDAHFQSNRAGRDGYNGNSQKMTHQSDREYDNYEGNYSPSRDYRDTDEYYPEESNYRASGKPRHFDGYNPPSQNSAVVETVFRKPKVYADLHEYDGVQVIDRVPTAIGYHSDDSGDEFAEEKSRATRYSFEVRQKQEEPPEEVEAEESEEEEEEEPEDEFDDKYANFMNTPTMKSVLSDGSESCPAVWRSFSEDEEAVERDPQKAVEEARRIRELNSVKSPERFESEVERDAKKISDGNENRSKKVTEPQKKKGMKGLKSLFLGGASRSSNWKRSGVVAGSSKSVSNKSRRSTDSRSVKSKSSKTRNPKERETRDEHTEAPIRKYDKRYEGVVSDEKSRRSRDSAERQKKATASNRYARKSVEDSRAATTRKDEAKRSESSQVGRSSQVNGRNSRVIPSQRSLYDPEESMESGGSGSGSDGTSTVPSSKKSTPYDDPEELIMAVRGQSVRGRKVEVEKEEDPDEEDPREDEEYDEVEEENRSSAAGVSRSAQQETPNNDKQEDGFLDYVVNGFNSLANYGFEKPLSFLDWSKEELEIAKLEQAATSPKTIEEGGGVKDDTIVEKEDGASTGNANAQQEATTTADDSGRKSRSKVVPDSSRRIIDTAKQDSDQKGRRPEAQRRQDSNEPRTVKSNRSQQRAQENEDGSGRKQQQKQQQQKQREERASRSRPTAAARKPETESRRTQSQSTPTQQQKKQQRNDEQKDRKSSKSGGKPSSEGGKNSSQHTRGSKGSKEVKSLRLDAVEGGRYDVPENLRDGEDPSVSVSPDGLPLMAIEIPTPAPRSNDDEDCSISILGLEKKKSSRKKTASSSSQASRRSKRSEYMEPSEEKGDAEAASTKSKQKKPSLIGKFLGRGGKN